MDATFDIDPDIFHERKRRRIAAMNNQEAPAAKPAPTSLPGQIHEISTFLPGRLEFEHELDNDAEDLVKDLEFGVVYEYGGDQIIEDVTDEDVKARMKWDEDKRMGLNPALKNGTRQSTPPAGKAPLANGINGHHTNGVDVKKRVKTEDPAANAEDESDETQTQPQPYETKDSIAFKLTLLEMYFQRVDKRMEAKAVVYDRGLLEYKKVCLHVPAIHTLLTRTLFSYKRQRRRSQRRRKNFFIDYDHLQDCKQLKIMKPFRRICYVSTLNLYCAISC